MKKTSFLSHNMTSKIYMVCVIELKYNIANIIRENQFIDLLTLHKLKQIYILIL